MLYIFLICICILLILFLQIYKESFTNNIRTLTYSKVHNSVIHTLQGTNDKYVILIHSSPLNQDMWMPLLQYFQTQSGSTLITYDLRGHGTAWEPVDSRYNNSDPNNVQWSFRLFADDLAKIIKGTIPEEKKVSLLGYGFGASVAQQYAIDNPDKIEELILLNAFIKNMPVVKNHLEMLASYISKYPQLNYLTQSPQIYNEYLCLWFDINNINICPENNSDKADISNSYIYSLVKMMLREASAITHLQTDKMLVGNDFTEQWLNASIPYKIKIVTATRDPLVPTNEELTGYNIIKKVQPNAIFEVVDGKHGFGMSNIKQVASLIQ